jgi:seryl-tRNA synthetase
MPAPMEKIIKAQKELYRDLKKTEAEVQSLQETIAQVKALGHPVEEQEKQLEKMKQHLKESRQRIEDLWEYSVPYGQA